MTKIKEEKVEPLRGVNMSDTISDEEAKAENVGMLKYIQNLEMRLHQLNDVIASKRMDFLFKFYEITNDVEMKNLIEKELATALGLIGDNVKVVESSNE